MLETIIKPFEAEFSGELALAYYDFRDRSSFLHNATKTMRSASLIKLPILLQVLSEVAQGKHELSQRFNLRKEDQVAGAGVLHSLNPNLPLTLEDLLTLMIIVSDNTATNMLIDLLGETELNAFMHSLGLSQTKLIGKLQLTSEQQNDEQRSGKSNQTCAADMLGLLLRLEHGELLPEPLTELALGILKKQQFNEALARYLPTDGELSNKPVTVASKSGCLRGLWHDAALVYGDSAQPLYALVIMTDHSNDLSYSWEQEGMMLIARLSKVIYEAALLKFEDNER